VSRNVNIVDLILLHPVRIMQISAPELLFLSLFDCRRNKTIIQEVTVAHSPTSLGI